MSAPFAEVALAVNSIVVLLGGVAGTRYLSTKREKLKAAADIEKVNAEADDIANQSMARYITTMDARLTAQDMKIAANDETIIALKAKIDLQNVVIAEQNVKIDELRERNKVLQSNNAQYQEEVEKLRSEVKALREHIHLHGLTPPPYPPPGVF